MSEFVIVNGHIVGHCPYLRALQWAPWNDPEPCDCADLLEQDDDEDGEVTE